VAHVDRDPIRVAPLDPRDAAIAARIHAVQMAAYAQEAALLGVTDFPPLRRTVADIQADTASFTGAFVDGVLAGVISIEAEPADTSRPSTVPEITVAQITALVVDPPYQRRGVARRLLRHVLDAHAGRAMTVSTGADNGPARALYAAHGFVETARRTVTPAGLVVVTLRRAATA
jgi:ribosomal protein S18 acetylase RimI-like enzyme